MEAVWTFFCFETMYGELKDWRYIFLSGLEELQKPAVQIEGDLRWADTFPWPPYNGELLGTDPVLLSHNIPQLNDASDGVAVD